MQYAHAQIRKDNNQISTNRDFDLFRLIKANANYVFQIIKNR